MLLELRVENLLLLERAELRLGAGLNVITGETGAGKTVLAHALDLLLGGRPRPGIVRPGAPEAYVEGIFAVPPGMLADPALAELRERLPDDAGELVLGRRVGADGRTRAFVQGRSAAAGDLREVGGRLISFYGQHEHRRLTLSSAQLEALDAFCGREHVAARAAFARAHARVLELRREADELRARAGARERDRDLLAFELNEIESVSPSVAEEGALVAARERLRRLDGLRAAAASGAEALAPEGGEDHGVAALTAEAERLADSVSGADPTLDALAERLRSVRIEAEELGAELSRYAASLEGDGEGPPEQRLEQVEERLELFDRLKRKHGGSVEAVLAHAERCRAELERLDQSGDALERIEAALAEAVADADERATALTAAREEAGPRLAACVLEELSHLAMEGASFQVLIHPRTEAGPLGRETVEFVIAPNPGVPAASLRDTASGGELSRVMLALMGVASAGAGPQATLVFDEVDAGIGGQTARAVGERLRRLAAGRQVLCITHLPQVASLADQHFRIEKEPGAGVARASVDELGEEGVVEELCRMLGADRSDAGARRHAEELLAAA